MSSETENTCWTRVDKVLAQHKALMDKVAGLIKEDGHNFEEYSERYKTAMEQIVVPIAQQFIKRCNNVELDCWYDWQGCFALHLYIGINADPVYGYRGSKYNSPYLEFKRDSNVNRILVIRNAEPLTGTHEPPRFWDVEEITHDSVLREICDFFDTLTNSRFYNKIIAKGLGGVTWKMQ